MLGRNLNPGTCFQGELTTRGLWQEVTNGKILRQRFLPFSFSFFCPYQINISSFYRITTIFWFYSCAHISMPSFPSLCPLLSFLPFPLSPHLLPFPFAFLTLFSSL